MCKSISMVLAVMDMDYFLNCSFIVGAACLKNCPVKFLLDSGC